MSYQGSPRTLEWESFPFSWGLTMDGTPGPAQDRSHTRIHAGPEAAPRGTRTFTGPDRTWGLWGLKFIWDPDSDIGNLTRQIQDI